MSSDSSRYMFKHHPETCDPDDYWGQVKRTVNGKPVSPEQIGLIVDSITDGLQLGSDDVLLDLCCGNGALTSHLFARCAGGLGVDYSKFLIDVANSRFSRNASERYVLADALDFVQNGQDPGNFTKALCYGAFPYFGPDAARSMLRGLNLRFERVTHLYLGQLPDKSRIGRFFTDRDPLPGEADDPGSLLGLWRTPEELTALAEEAGWTAQPIHQPDRFFASHYRFDALLTRR